MQPTTQLTRTERLRQANELRADKTLEAKRHFEQVDANRATQETILKAFKSLVAYLDDPQRVTKTAVVNQLESIATPDALKVAQAVQELHATVKTRKEVDLSEIAGLLKSVLAEAKQIPKEHQDITLPQPIDHTSQFKSLETALNNVTAAVKAQKLHVEAPVVKVEKPDLSALKDLLTAFKAFKIPETPLPFAEKGKEQKAQLEDGDLRIVARNKFISEKFDEVELVYSDFDEDETNLQGVKYFYKKKKVAEVKLTYNEDRLLRVKKL